MTVFLFPQILSFHITLNGILQITFLYLYFGDGNGLDGICEAMRVKKGEFVQKTEFTR